MFNNDYELMLQAANGEIDLHVWYSKRTLGDENSFPAIITMQPTLCGEGKPDVEIHSCHGSVVYGNVMSTDEALGRLIMHAEAFDSETTAHLIAA